MPKSKTILIACGTAALLAIISAPQSIAQLAPSGTAGDRAVYTIGTTGVIADVNALPSSTLTHDFDTETIADTANSFELGAEGGVDDTKIFLTGGHHIVIYGQEWDGGGERSGADSYLKIGGSKVPYGHSAAYTRDGANRESFTRGGTILNVAQGESLELESQRLDVFTQAADIGNRPLTMQNADVQLIKLDDTNLEFLRLKAVTSPLLMAAGASGPANVPYDSQDEIDAGSFGHSTTVANDQITLKTPGHYLIFANTGTTIATGNKRNNLTQKLFLDADGAGANPPVAIAGGATTAYLRHASVGDGVGGLIDEGAMSVGVLVEVTAANSVLTVEITRDATSASVDSTVTLDQIRTGLAIAKLPSYGDYISLGESGSTNNADINTATATARSFASNTGVSNDSFSYAPGTSASQIVVNKANDFLFLSSHHVEDYDTPGGGVRTTVSQGFQTTTGGALSYGAGGSYNRDQPAGNQAARDSGNWAGAIIRGGTDVSVGGGVETTTLRFGNAPVVVPTGLSFQGINISSISIPPSNDPTVTINNTLNVNTNTVGNFITDEAHLLTEDADTAASGLTYIIDTVPNGGTVKLSGLTVPMGGSFTQDDIDTDKVTFDAGGSETATGGFDFTVSDGGASPASGTFVINVTFPVATITIAGDGDVSEGSTAGWTITSDEIPTDGSITVGLAYSGGSATAGSDYSSGPVSIDIAMGAATADLDLTTLMDGIAEGSELINVSITGVSTTASVTAASGNPSSARVTILDGNASPTATNINQIAVGTGTVPLLDIVVTDDDDSETSLETATAAIFEFTGATNVTLFDPALTKADDDSSFTLTPALTQASGFQVEIVATPAAGDLTGTVQLWEIGGTSNGSGVYLVDGVPHLLVKANGVGGDSPTDSGDPGFVDLSWEPDDNIVVPLSAGSLQAGSANTIALVMDISGNTVTYSVNDVPESTANLSPQSGVNFVGDHTVNMGVGAGTGSGGTNDGAGTFASSMVTNPSGGFASIDSVRFWNEVTGSTTKTSATPDDVTVTLTLDNALNGTLTATNGGGAATVLGSGTAALTITGNSVDVSTALATVEFVTNGSTSSIETVSVSVDDGDEDGGGALTGTIAITDAVADPIYVDDDFSGSIGDAIADADSGPPVSPANFGVSAFSNLADALAAVQSTGTVIVNDGDYSTESITLADMVSVSITDTAGPVQIGDIATGLTNSIVIQGGNTLELGAANGASQVIDSIISGTGNLTKVGTGLVVLRGLNTFTGTTAITGGILRLGFEPTAPIAGELAGDGPVVVNIPGVLEFATGVDTTKTHTGVISGTGSVAAGNDGTLVFDGLVANTFSGGFTLGDGAISSFNGIDGVKAGFVVVNHNGHLGTGKVLSRGGQLQAGTSGLVIPNDVDVTGGGFRCGGTVDFELSGNINPIDNDPRGYSNFGLEGIHVTISGNITLATATGNVNFEGSDNQDNGTWTISGDISGIGSILVQNNFDDGEITFSGTHSYTGTTGFSSGTTFDNATHTGGGAYSVNTGATLAGSGSTDAALTVNSGATLSPGGSGSVGTFTTGGLTINAGGTLEADLGGDMVVANGPVSINTATLELGFTPAAGASPITIITNNDAGSVVGEFAGFAEGAAVDPVGLGWNGSVTYLQGGNDVAVTFSGLTIIGQWREDNFADPANAGAGANTVVAPNSLTNLQNFAFDLDPTAPAGTLDVNAGAGTITSLGPPAIWVDPTTNRIYLRHTRRTDFAAIPLTITDQFSRNPTLPFEDNAVAPMVIATGTGDGGAVIEAVQTEFPLVLPDSGGKGRYGRVDVTTP